MSEDVWHVRNVPHAVRKKIRLYAVEHGLSMAEALEALVNLALREEGLYVGEDKSDFMVIKNKDGLVVYMQGLLPDGTFGIVADEERPFTDEELADPVKFKERRDDTARRHTINATETKLDE